MRMTRSEVLSLANESAGEITYSAQEFIDYWSGTEDYSPIADMEESAYETHCQILNETAMFGDAWPGAWPAYHSQKKRLGDVKARLKSLYGE